MNNNNYNLYGAYEGYLKGNLFPNLYDPYKNYKIANINIKNEKDELSFNINQVQFAMHELNLLLDINPNNQNILNLFTKYKNMYKDLVKEYEDTYGPINVDCSGTTTPFNWVTDFPWEVR